MMTQTPENTPTETAALPDQPAPARAENEGAAPTPRLAPEQIQDVALETLGRMLEMLQFQTRIETAVDGQNLRVLIHCEDAGRLIGRGGNTLQSLQFLLNRMVIRRQPGAPRIYLDVEGFKEQMDSEVLKRAEAAAEQVRRWGESLELAPMNAYERRVIHQRFAEDPEITAESVEDGSDGKLKRMILRLKK